MSEWYISDPPQTADEFYRLLNELRSSPGGQEMAALVEQQLADTAEADAAIAYDELAAQVRRGIGDDLQAAAARQGAVLGDAARATATAEKLYALHLVANDLTAEGEVEARRYASEEAVRIESGQSSYKSISERYSRLHGGQEAAIESDRNVTSSFRNPIPEAVRVGTKHVGPVETEEE
jgi:ribose 1,5-bisphosphokinase PhnN